MDRAVAQRLPRAAVRLKAEPLPCPSPASHLPPPANMAGSAIDLSASAMPAQARQA
ncbi:hypothetical protein OF001_U30063 [Pseudomonas sp. OF001]|nr:hypothetical protein OF001_U30063 [Pseudomonas sp. OF001]